MRHLVRFQQVAVPGGHSCKQVDKVVEVGPTVLGRLLRCQPFGWRGAAGVQVEANRQGAMGALWPAAHCALHQTTPV